MLGIALALGVWLCSVCILLGALAFGAIVFLYLPFTDPEMQLLSLLATGIIGGLLSLFAFGRTHCSYDAMCAHRRAELAERDAQLRAKEVELRTAQTRQGVTGSLATPPTAPRQSFRQR